MLILVACFVLWLVFPALRFKLGMTGAGIVTAITLLLVILCLNAQLKREERDRDR